MKLDSEALRRVREIRARAPEEIAVRAAARRRRALLGEDGRIFLIAADHPARNALSVGPRPLVMGDREELLRRLCSALNHPGVDGVLATPDVIEDLLLLGALDDRLAFGSMNRGGLVGARFELDDRFTAYDPSAIEASGLDGGKMLCRIDLDDAGSLATLEACGNAITDLAHRHLTALVEPFMSRRIDGRVVNDLTADSVIRSVTIAAALGAVSSYTWLKLPVVDEMERVATSTTLPILLLGGDPPGGADDDTLGRWESALAGPGVRGLVVGRSLLYPPDDDVTAAVDQAAALVHPTISGSPRGLRDGAPVGGEVTT